MLFSSWYHSATHSAHSEPELQRADKEKNINSLKSKKIHEKDVLS